LVGLVPLDEGLFDAVVADGGGQDLGGFLHRVGGSDVADLVEQAV